MTAAVLTGAARPAVSRRSWLTLVAATVYALQQAGTWGWGSARTWTVLAAGLVVLAGFVLVQLRESDPLVQVRLLARRAFLGDVLVLFATQFSMLALTLYAALYSQNLLGYSPIRAGFSSLAMIIPLSGGGGSVVFARRFRPGHQPIG